jgi:hypothetical protein
MSLNLKNIKLITLGWVRIPTRVVYPLLKKEQILAAYKISKNATQVAKDHSVNVKTVISWLSEHQLNNKFLPTLKKSKIKDKQIKLIHSLYHEHGNLRIVSEFFNKVSDVKLSSTSIYHNRPANFFKKVKKQACDILAEARDEDKISHVDQNTGFFNRFDFINFLSGYIWAHIALAHFFI